MKLETKFQDKDFDFGEIVKAKVTTYYDENKVVVMADRARGGISRFEYNSIKDFTDHWTDVPEEPKGIIKVEKSIVPTCVHIEYSTEEEAEKSVEKLKAWERLRDKGFRFEGIRQDYTRFNQQEPMMCGRKYLQFNKSEDEEWMKDNWEDLDLLFGGEE